MKLKAWYAAALIVVAIHILAFQGYPKTSEPTELVKWLAAIQWIVPTALLYFTTSKGSRLLARVARIKVVDVLAPILLLASVVCTLLNLPGLWWSWSTMSMLITMVTIIVYRSAYLKESSSLLLGVLATFAGIASWEIVYQSGLLTYYDFFGSAHINYLIVLAEQLMWIIPYIIYVLMLYRKYGMVLQFNIYTIACFSLFLIATLVWFLNGMDIPLLWYKGNGPFVNEAARPLMISISRASMTFWLLAIISTVRRVK